MPLAWPKAAFVDPGLRAASGCVRIDQVDFCRAFAMADLKTTPFWLMRFNTVLLWLNPGLSGVAALVLALLVIAAAGEREAGNGARAAPQIVRIADAPLPAVCRPAALPPELRDLRLYD
jgi:hypothetical protein